MNFGNLLKNLDANKKRLFRWYFTLGSLLIITIFTVYVYFFQKIASKESMIVPNLINQFMFYASHENFENMITQYILHEIIAKVDFPIIITNNDQMPIYWKNIQVDELAIWNNLPENMKQNVLRRLERMRSKGHIIPLNYSDGEEFVQQYVFYEDSTAIKRLKLLPYVEIAFILFFLSFGIYAMQTIQNNEKKMLWVGLAKETAHQFGTPISSLIGWLDFMRMKVENSPQKEEFQSMIDDMTTDVLLLKKVASRFGKVGSNVKLVPTNIDNIIHSCQEYFQKRLPHINNEIRIEYTSYHPNTSIMLDEELMSWAFENLIRNCIDAMKYKSGLIHITSTITNQKFVILITDQGVGIAKSMFDKVFEPGVTTKSRGWGLGLSLSKRIVEEYHSGKIKVLDSVPEEGTTIEIMLPMHK